MARDAPRVGGRGRGAAEPPRRSPALSALDPQRSAARAALAPALSAMPCGEDWLSHPLGIVQGFFGEWRVASRAGRERSLRDQACRAATLGTAVLGNHCRGLAWPRAWQPSRSRRLGPRAQVPPPPVTCRLPGSGSLVAGTQLPALAVIDGLVPADGLPSPGAADTERSPSPRRALRTAAERSHCLWEPAGYFKTSGVCVGECSILRNEVHNVSHVSLDIRENASFFFSALLTLEPICSVTCSSTRAS